MRPSARFVCCLFCFAVICLVPGVVFAQSGTDEILANQNRTAAGTLVNAALTVDLEIRKGRWHAEAEDGPPLFVQAFGEVGKPSQIPGPMLRMPEGTTVHVKVTNKLTTKATVYGLNTRPGDAKNPGFELKPDESRELSFVAGAPGTYYYWARTTVPSKVNPAGPTPTVFEDAPLNGAFIVDPPGPVRPDRVFVINTMFAKADIIHPTIELLSINGKSYPYTEPLEYTLGENIRWRVINPGFAEHPMHLHGAFYRLLSLGDFESDTTFPAEDLQSVVTEDLPSMHTMTMEWTPSHAGRWLFHCHFHLHIAPSKRLPTFTQATAEGYDPSKPAPAAAHHEDMTAMNDMAGLVLTINIKPSANPLPPNVAAVPRKIDLVIEPTAAEGKLPTFSCAVREGKKIVASEDRSVGPPIVVTRGEPVEVTVLNHLKSSTAIHWHGIELDSYYDGVIGGGIGNQITPAIAPGTSFVARFTPNRAGTFIYHTHAADPGQLTGGVYGGLIVLEPGESFDAQHDRLLVIGSHDPTFYTKQITVNGNEAPAPFVMKAGEKYRLRVINIAPNLIADLRLGTKEETTQWREIAKDGAVVPSRLAKPCDAALHIASGETYDFEFQPSKPGEIPLQIKNPLVEEKLVGKIVVQ